MYLGLRLRRWLRFCLLVSMTCLLLVRPGFSADRIYVNYGIIGRSISVESLEIYARTGELTDELASYSRYLTAEQLEGLRNGLVTRADVDVVTVSQFLYTPQGEAILAGLGDLVQTVGRQNGAKALRGAVIQAAADPEGLTAINVLKYFPTRGVRLDLQRLSSLASAAITAVNQTREVTAQLKEQSKQAARENALDRATLLFLPGTVSWTKQSYEAATLPTDLYLPTGENVPLVVMSHGLGGDRTTLAYLAEHLASHGFAVAVVEHPGSSESQLTELFEGRASEAVTPTEMVQRPLAISSLLDTLAADPTLQNRLDTDNVGMLGQSLGGYTTLALAGATLSPTSLATSCPPALSQLNISLLLQCLVPTLSQPFSVLADERVKSAIAINPLGSAAFGETGYADIDIPLMMVSGSDDTVTPALAEQVRPFSWLTTAQRYLALIEGGTHFSAIYNPDAVEAVAVPEVVVGRRPDLAQRYVMALGLAFFETHLNQETDYSAYLTSAYAETLSQTALPLSLVKSVELAEG